MKSSQSVIRTSFPLKLHDMLEEAEKFPSWKGIISWQPHGRAFIVHNTYLFLQAAKKRSFFKQTKYPSFQRQLNLYGFCRISSGIDKGAYHHNQFLRGQRDLCYEIQRITIKGTKVRKPASPATEPDLYSMPFLPPSSHHGDRVKQVGPVVSRKTATRNVQPVLEDIPLVLELQLPTDSGQQPLLSPGLTFVRPVVHRQPKMIRRHQTNSHSVAANSNGPLALDQGDGNDHPPNLPLMRLKSDEDKTYLFLDEAKGDGLALNRSWHTTQQEGNLELERLPADTELEEFIALYMARMDRL